MDAVRLREDRESAACSLTSDVWGATFQRMITDNKDQSRPAHLAGPFSSPDYAKLIYQLSRQLDTSKG